MLKKSILFVLTVLIALPATLAYAADVPLDNFTDGVIDHNLWEWITTGTADGNGAITRFVEQNNRLESQAARQWSVSTGRVTNTLQTKYKSKGDFFGKTVTVKAQVYWVAHTLGIGTPPNSIARVSICDGANNEVILWTAPQETWTSGSGTGLRTKTAEQNNLMQFDFNAQSKTVKFTQDGNVIGSFDISGLTAWQIRFYTSGQNFQSSFSETAQVFISSITTSTAACPSVKGTWKFTGTAVTYDAGSKVYAYTPFTYSMKILSQSGCLFYGYKDQNVNGNQFTGVIKGTSVTISAPHVMFDGQLTSLDTATGKYKKITTTGSQWPDGGGTSWPADDKVGSYTGTMALQ
jgi:hypothetical protein